MSGKVDQVANYLRKLREELEDTSLVSLSSSEEAKDGEKVYQGELPIRIAPAIQVAPLLVVSSGSKAASDLAFPHFFSAAEDETKHSFNSSGANLDSSPEMPLKAKKIEPKKGKRAAFKTIQRRKGKAPTEGTSKRTKQGGRDVSINGLQRAMETQNHIFKHSSELKKALKRAQTMEGELKVVKDALATKVKRHEDSDAKVPRSLPSLKSMLLDFNEEEYANQPAMDEEEGDDKVGDKVGEEVGTSIARDGVVKHLKDQVMSCLREYLAICMLITEMLTCLGTVKQTQALVIIYCSACPLI
ncbi:hypothetical protein Acr_29g0008210 [Actinidia rufa]|uniref:Uncharacterized protein n=1 Tax=Actinidia rufa TaxID=165716 RepID=A0A7J0HF09_9ERIC|nr:hypothetical protein Acr_29g0008210 [Actinidia rufa]